jgi:hypothetical protein
VVVQQLERPLRRGLGECGDEHVLRREQRVVRDNPTILRGDYPDSPLDRV